MKVESPRLTLRLQRSNSFVRRYCLKNVVSVVHRIVHEVNPIYRMDRLSCMKGVVERTPDVHEVSGEVESNEDKADTGLWSELVNVRNSITSNACLPALPFTLLNLERSIRPPKFASKTQVCRSSGDGDQSDLSGAEDAVLYVFEHSLDIGAILMLS